MPYDSITELPEAVRNRYSPRCQNVFLKAFNRTLENSGTSEEDAFKVAHTAAGMCKDAGKADSTETLDEMIARRRAEGTYPVRISSFSGGPEGYGTGHTSKAEAEPTPMKAAELDDDDMSAWFAGKIPRRLLVIPFSGPIQHPRSSKGIDMDGEWFSKATDIKPDWFERRPSDWHHSKDPSGLLNGALIGYVDRLGTEKGEQGAPDDYGWWADFWFNAGEKRLAAIRQLNAKGAQLFGSSYAYPNLVKRDAKTGHIDVWPYMMQTLSTSPQNTNSIHRPAKAVLDAFTEADISVEHGLTAMLAELDTLRDLDANLTGEAAAKAGRELSGANLKEIEDWLGVLDDITKRAKSLRDRVRTKYVKTEDVSSNS